MLHRLLLIAMALSAVGPAYAQDAQRYLSVVLGSAHFGADLNGVNPGLLVGTRWPAESGGLEYHLEGGVFYNSYEEVSPILMVGASHHLATLGRVDLRGGLSVGTGYYAELAPILERDYGIPNIQGFIPLAAATLSLRDTRNETVEYRLTALPGDAGIGVLNLSIAFDF